MGLSGFDTSGRLRLSPNDPDAPGLLARYPDRYMITSPEQAAPYLAELQSQGNPTTAAGVYAQTAAAGPVPQSWLGSVAEAAAATAVAPALMDSFNVPHPAYDFATGATAVGPGAGFNPQNVAAGVAQLRSIAQQIYGSAELGTTRQSSVALENGASGIRPGSMERIVVPAWAARERGFPS